MASSSLAFRSASSFATIKQTFACWRIFVPLNEGGFDYFGNHSFYGYMVTWFLLGALVPGGLNRRREWFVLELQWRIDVKLKLDWSGRSFLRLMRDLWRLMLGLGFSLFSFRLLYCIVAKFVMGFILFLLGLSAPIVGPMCLLCWDLGVSLAGAFVCLLFWGLFVPLVVLGLYVPLVLF